MSSPDTTFNEKPSMIMLPAARTATSKEPIWTLTRPFSQGETPPVGTFGVDRGGSIDDTCGGNSTACCKDLKPDDERHLISPEIVRDVIIGLSDGLTVPFALTAGLSSLGSSRLVTTAGLAELCAGAISMGLGGYLASRAELDHYRYLRRQTSSRIQHSCPNEIDRQVHSIFGPLGVKPAASHLLSSELQVAERDSKAIQISARDRDLKRTRRRRLPWMKSTVRNEGDEKGNESLSDEAGLTPFFLKFGEGIEEVPVSRLYISAQTIGLSYFIGGLIPLIPYFATPDANLALYISVGVTGFVLFIFGGSKAYFTGAKGGWQGYLTGAVSMTLLGGLAAGAAFGLVKAMHVQE